MDAVWASALAGKDYIFPSDWSAAFWFVNFAYLMVAAAIYALRCKHGVATRQEPGLLTGAAALVCVFLLSWPLLIWDLALALQLQPSRIFWMMDFLATVYIAWLLAEAPSTVALRRTVATGILIVAVSRGIFVWRVEHPGAPIARIGFAQDDWTAAMNWISRTPADAYVLADPGHAWKFGTSVRVSGLRDVYLEEVKDLAIALYSREVAVEAVQRIRDSQNFHELGPDELQSLAARYDLDYLVVDRDVNLPLAYRNGQFRVYELRRTQPTSP
jgi:hypothetical protein